MRHIVRIPTTVEEDPPVAPAFAKTGLMAQSDPSFYRPSSRTLGIAAVVGTFVVGLLIASLFVTDDGAMSAAATAPTQGTASADVELEAGNVATRAASADLTDVGGSTSASGQTSRNAQNLATTVLVGQRPLDAAGVPAPDLTQSATASFEVLRPNTLRMLREGIVAGAYEIETVKYNGIDRLRLRVENAGVTGGLTGDTLIRAAEAGRIDMADALRTPTGEIDTDTMIFNLVQSSLLRDQTIESINAAYEMSRKVFAASNARTTDVGGLRVYTVRAGDSLAYISLQFYGVLGAYTRILEANRDTLQSPDKIQVGQRLIIPS